jgi:hypothetical protein
MKVFGFLVPVFVHRQAIFILCEPPSFLDLVAPLRGLCMNCFLTREATGCRSHPAKIFGFSSASHFDLLSASAPELVGSDFDRAKGCRPVFSSVELSLGPASKNMPRGAKSPARFCLPPSVFVPAFDLFHVAGSRSLLSLCAQVVLPGQ